MWNSTLIILKTNRVPQMAFSNFTEQLVLAKLSFKIFIPARHKCLDKDWDATFPANWGEGVALLHLEKPENGHQDFRSRDSGFRGRIFARATGEDSVFRWDQPTTNNNASLLKVDCWHFSKYSNAFSIILFNLPMCPSN